MLNELRDNAKRAYLHYQEVRHLWYADQASTMTMDKARDAWKAADKEYKTTAKAQGYTVVWIEAIDNLAHIRNQEELDQILKSVGL